MSERPEAIDAQRIARPHNLQPTTDIPAREDITPGGPATPGVETGGKIHRPTSDEPSPRETRQTKPRHDGHGKKQHRSFSEAVRCHRHEWHDRNWWKQNCNTIVFVNSAYYFLDAGYWYPAWGYDPGAYYAYDGPIYAYNDLSPDQVVANVQAALQQQGYYHGDVDGLLGPLTRAAAATYQRDHGLYVTSAIDRPTLESLGMS